MNKINEIKMNKKLEEFIKSFPYSQFLKSSESKYMFDLRNRFVMDVNANHKISLRFFAKRFNNDDNIVKSFEQALINNFRTVETIISCDLIEHKFYVRKFEDINQLIEIFDSLALISTLR